MLLSAGAGMSAAMDYTGYVNTLQGTDSSFGLSHGNTYPTAGMPFGVHFWSPQTGKNGDGFKYAYSADAIRGFAQAHQCSPWVSDYAVYSFMPVVGELVVNEDKRATRFSHDNETGAHIITVSGLTTVSVRRWLLPNGACTCGTHTLPKAAMHGSYSTDIPT